MCQNNKEKQILLGVGASFLKSIMHKYISTSYRFSMPLAILYLSKFELKKQMNIP